MIILDTDHLTVIQRESEPAYSTLMKRLHSAAPDEIYTTIINVEEQMRGWLVVLSRSKKMEQEIFAYHQLQMLFAFFTDTPMLAFDEVAAARFISLRRARLHLGTMDLKIAAITLAHGAILLSRNLSDFRRIPNLQVEDWTQPQ
jgi:tRNA(fMet)-specific endonuclease VapC